MKAKKYITSGIFLLGLIGVHYLKNHNNNKKTTPKQEQLSSSSSSQTNESSIQENSTSEITYKDAQETQVKPPKEVNFRSEQDVRTFLSMNKFEDKNGYTILFMNNGNELYLNGQPLSSSSEISNIARKSAIVRVNGPYGKTTFFLKVVEGGAGLYDPNDGTVYTVEGYY